MTNKPIDLPPVMANIRSAFIARDPDYLTKKWGLGGRLEELNARMKQLIDTSFQLPIFSAELARGAVVDQLHRRLDARHGDARSPGSLARPQEPAVPAENPIHTLVDRQIG